MTVSDTATLSDALRPQAGTSCSGLRPVRLADLHRAAATVDVRWARSVPTTRSTWSGPVTVTPAGKYYWVASYTGDANNDAVAGTCGDANETSVVGPPPRPS